MTFNRGAVEGGVEVYAYADGSVPASPALFVTVTATEPPPCGGATAVIVLASTILIRLAADGPNGPSPPVKKFVPVMVPAVPPAPAPVAGEMPVTGAPPLVGAVPPVVNDHTGPRTVRFAMVLEAIF